MSSSDMLATISFEHRILAEEMLARVGAALGLEILILTVDALFHDALQDAAVSRASSGSQREPQITLMTFQPAPRNAASSSWMILPLPRTGPSSRCRLQLTTKIRLSSSSRTGIVNAPIDSGSSISPSPQNAQTLRSEGATRPRFSR